MGRVLSPLLGSRPATPAPPPPPPPAPPPPTMQEPEARASAEEAGRRAAQTAAARGRGSTILTGELGVTDPMRPMPRTLGGSR